MVVRVIALALFFLNVSLLREVVGIDKDSNLEQINNSLRKREIEGLERAKSSG